MDKYYIPEIEDIRVGYEFEVSYLHENKFTKDKIRTPPELSGLMLNFYNRQIRTPYLTIEQIEDKGFVKQEIKFIAKQRVIWIPDYTLPTAFGSLRLYIKNLDAPYKSITIEKYVKASGEPFSMSTTFVVFNGECRSINEFRTILKYINHE